MNETNLLYKIAITQIDKVGAVLAKTLISYCGGVENVFLKNGEVFGGKDCCENRQLKLTMIEDAKDSKKRLMI